MTLRTVAIVQARMASQRLPGKVLAPIRGEPMVAHVMARLARARTLDEIVLATTVGREDDVLAELARERGWAISRGHRDDVLDRYLRAASRFGADVIVRVTSDCPLIDPQLVDRVVDALADDVDYASNTLEPRSYPRGLDTEVMTRRALDAAARNDHDPRSREHVTPFLYRHPERFRLRRVANPVDESSERWCVDVPEDLELVRRLADAVGDGVFDWREVLAVRRTHPEWRELNRAVLQKGVG